MGMTRGNIHGNECGTVNGDEGDEPLNRVRMLTTVWVRASGEYEKVRWKRIRSLKI